MNFDAYVRKFYDTGAHKLLHEQREAYFAQSAQTKDGAVAEYRAPDAKQQGEMK